MWQRVRPVALERVDPAGKAGLADDLIGVEDHAFDHLRRLIGHGFAVDGGECADARAGQEAEAVGAGLVFGAFGFGEAGGREQTAEPVDRILGSLEGALAELI